MRYRLPVTLALVLCAAAPARAADRTVDVGAGYSARVTAPRPFGKVHLMNPGVAEVLHLKGRGFTVVGVSPGATEIHLLPKGKRGRIYRIRVRVRKSITTRLYRLVRAWVGRAPGLVVRMVGDFVLVEGRAHRLADYRRVRQARRVLGPKVINLAGYHPKAVKQLNRILRKAGVSGAKATQ